MKNSIRVAICVMLVVAVLAMSLSVLAVDEGDRIVAQEYLWAYYIYVFLDSIGIDVTYQGIIEYTDEIQDTIIDWVIDYIADEIEAEQFPSNYTVNQWIAPWQANYDYWGNLQFNSTMLEDLQDFGEWLKAKLSLVNDATVTLNPVYTAGGYYVYQLNTYYAASYDDGSSYNEFVSLEAESGNYPLYGYFIARVVGNRAGGYYDYAVFLGPNQITGTNWIRYNALKSDGQEVLNVASANVYNLTQANAGDYYKQTLPFHYDSQKGYFKPIGEYAVFQDDAAFQFFLQNMVVQQVGDIQIVTADIVFPYQNPDYIPGDGVTIIDGSPTYQEITFSGVVENLPAIVSTGTVSNPGLDTFWGFIPVLAEQTKDAIVLTRGLIYELPEELVVTFYAVMGGLILFGIIKLMREH